MTTYYKVGESIKGPRIYVCFGSIVATTVRNRRRCNLKRHGRAHVVLPLRRARKRKHREPDKLRCRTATGEASSIDQKKRKVRWGDHTCFEAFLDGDAVCTINTPLQTIPQ